ncbi:hypothetical protein [Streptomyces bluensis]|uniref:hypothetical protein n=1 Tax=Streptomyces bluensis TaxID=33897 RepID=UPI001673397E|nr:hypothetical protein [Streptomyces bluensis]GGZ40639.1 hypothetical protein GCM10010344_01470 [Streptomyces bluensis]
MATDPVRRTPVDPEMEAAYGGRYEEDSFDYPSSAPARPVVVVEPPASRDRAKESASEPRSAEQPKAGRGVLGQLVAVRRNVLLAVAASLIVAGGLGVGLSVIGDTVSSDPAPGGADQVSAPRTPTPPPSVPGASTPVSDPTSGGTASGGTGANVTVPPQAAPSQPATPDRHDEDRRDPEREDGDRAEED